MCTVRVISLCPYRYYRDYLLNFVSEILFVNLVTGVLILILAISNQLFAEFIKHLAVCCLVLLEGKGCLC